MCSVKGHIILSCFRRSVDLLFAVQENLRGLLTFNVNDSELDGGWLEGILYVLLHVAYLQYWKGATAACCFIFILGQKLLTHFVWILLLNLRLDLIMDVKIFFAFCIAEYGKFSYINFNPCQHQQHLRVYLNSTLYIIYQVFVLFFKPNNEDMTLSVF